MGTSTRHPGYSGAYGQEVAALANRALALASGWLALLAGATAPVVVYRIGYEAEAG